MARKDPPEITTYAQAAAYLAAGTRSKSDRPHGHARRIVRGLAGVDSISLVYHQTPVVTWFADGRIAGWFAGWMTTTTMNHIQQYAGISPTYVYPPYDHENPHDWTPIGGHGWLASIRITNRRRNGGRGEGFTIWDCGDTSWPRSEPNIRKCRVCHGTGKIARGHYAGGDCDCTGGQRDYGSKILPLESTWGQEVIVWAPGQRTVLSSWADLIGTQPQAYSCSCKLCQSGCSSWQEYHWNVEVPSKSKDFYPTSASAPVHIEPADTSPDYSDSGDLLTQLLPGLHTYVECPACISTDRQQINARIIHLNDKHKWTREQIADWLDTLDADLRFTAAS